MAFLPTFTALAAAAKAASSAVKNTSTGQQAGNNISNVVNRATGGSYGGGKSGNSASSIGTYTTDQDRIRSIMNENSQKWHTADAETRKALEAENQRLASQLGGTVNFDPTTGTWGGSAAQPQQGPARTDYWDDVQARYDQQAAAEQAAINAYIAQTVNSLNSQKSGVNQSAEELARQAYISYMQSADKLPQALAASGYSGGMADSQALALETGLQNNQNQIRLNRDNTLNDIDSAIINAQLEGSIQGAQAQAELGRDAISAFQNYMNQQNAYANQDYWTKYGYDYDATQTAANQAWQAQQSQINRDWQSAESDKDRQESTTTSQQKLLQQQVLEMIQAGQLPGDDLLAAAGISKAYAQTMAPVYAQQLAGAGSGGTGGGMSGSGSNGTAGTTQDQTSTEPASGSVTQEQYNAAADRFDAGDYSPDVIGIMLAAGDSPDRMAAAAGFGSVISLGYGPIDEATLAQLVSSGGVTVLNLGGRLYYRKAQTSGTARPGTILR